LRDADCFGRIGGEEFGLLVCDSLENASAIAERLRQKVSQLSVNFDTVTFRLSTSIGVTQAVEDDSVSRLLARADKALYNAKVDGRNRVEITTT
jgi:diguanylate cyclase (GGDEF)-like protein